MKKNKKMFSILHNSIKYKVKLGNDNKVHVIGKGMISVLTKNVEKRFILDVYFVLELKHYFFSVGQQIDKGYSV